MPWAGILSRGQNEQVALQRLVHSMSTAVRPCEPVFSFLSGRGANSVLLLLYSIITLRFFFRMTEQCYRHTNNHSSNYHHQIACCKTVAVQAISCHGKYLVVLGDGNKQQAS